MVEVFNGNIDKAIRDVNRMLQLNGVVSEVKARGHHVKPCQDRASKKAARYANIRKHTSKSGKKAAKYMLSIFNPNILV